MRHSNIMKLDSKGRLLIPVHMRNKLEAGVGTEVMLISDDETNEIKIVPLIKDKNAELKFLLTGIPDSLAIVANMLANHNINILMSQSRTLVRGKMAEWDVIVDTSSSNNGNLDKLREELQTSKFVKNVEIVRK
jgi:bifunctional DNA-binding transcriptional regulator/antitoxin component of YhaV-PrlF toxin-antitoxin module